MDPFPLWWIVGSLGFLLSIYFSIAEGALLSYSRARLEELNRGDEAARARVAFYLEYEGRLLRSALIGDNTSNILLVVSLAVLFARSSPAGSGWPWASFGLALVLVLVFGEILPRTAAIRNAEVLLNRLLPSLYWTSVVLSPVVLLLNGLDWLVGVVTGRRKRTEKETIVEEIRSAAVEGGLEGLFEQEETSMLENILEFGQIHAAEVMTPRTAMIALPESMSVEEAIPIIVEQGHSRIPVFAESVDKVTGILFVKNLLRRWNDADVPIGKLSGTPFFIPEAKEIAELLKDFKEKKTHIAIVLDEYGGTAGLITIEDVLEEIVGEIEDEFDQSDDTRLMRIDERTVEVDASLTVDQVNEEFGLRLPEDADYETLGGFLNNELGKIPKSGDVFGYDNIEFTVLDADERKVNRVMLSIKLPTT